MKAYQLYGKIFSSKSLNELFEEKVSLSSAVGRDGTKVGIFGNSIDSEIALILSKVDARTYQFTSYNEKLILKGAEEPPRQISIPTVRDRLTLRAICEIVSCVFDDCKTPPPHEYIKKIRKVISELGDGYSFLRLDIQQYYPSINQKILLRRIRKRIRKPEIVSLIEKAIKTPTGRRRTPENLSLEGVPQGLSISNILSAIYLENIDDKYKAQVHYFRYVDDILIICKTSDVSQIYEDLKGDLKRKSKLKCHPLEEGKPGKTRTELLHHGIDYLGFHITDKCTSIRRSSYKRMFSNLMKVFTNYKYKKNKRLFLWRLNLKITGCVFEGKRLGWMFFFSQTMNTSQLMRLDAFVQNLITKYHLESEREKVKTFIKAYHEIRHNYEDTAYFPKFEEYTLEKKIDVICLLTGKKKTEVSTWAVDMIEAKFRTCTSREVAQLEKDLMEAFS